MILKVPKARFMTTSALVAVLLVFAPVTSAAHAEDGSINGWDKDLFIAAAVEVGGLTDDKAEEVWGDERLMSAVGVQSETVTTKTERAPTAGDLGESAEHGFVPLTMMNTVHDRTVTNIFGHVVRQLIVYKDFACGSDSFRVLSTSYSVDANSTIGESFTGLAGSQDYFNGARTSHTTFRNAHFQNLLVPGSSNLWVEITVTSGCGVTKSAGGQ
ncbi:hypothetical protein [Agromyces archimandritae]|uniref:Secreted protein n=1 Tax=Agromyces archimandritae TaxID=2781962 RepID=A0A975FNU6_9MICO|nr:hypothetical protein [Agromyces archimandritae]QTX05850.1 hypothetical protein G127AT_06540 [Agromyces archimandritae]